MKHTLIAFHYTKFDLENRQQHLAPLVERLKAACQEIAQGIYLARTEQQAALIDTARHHLKTQGIPSAILTVDAGFPAAEQHQPMQIVGLGDYPL